MRLVMALTAPVMSAVCLAAACSSGDAASSVDGFDRGTQPLVLLPAPAGLCEGAGAPRECETPGTCSSERGPAPSFSGSPTGSGSGGAASSAPLPGPVDPTLSAPPSEDNGGTTDPPQSEPACDGGLADGGMCGEHDAGAQVAQISQALERSSCSALDRGEPATLFLSADDSNSTASATIARKLIRRGRMVPSEIVRAYEFLNYYSFSFEPAPPGEVRIVPQLSSCPEDGQLSFQVALQSEARDPDARRPLNVTFVLDTSGSMSGEPIAIERAAVRAMAGQLRRGDVVSMVTWSTDQRDILAGHTVSGPDDPAVLAAANGIEANGGTDLNAGLRRGYKLAEAFRSEDRINRVVLISDGQANVGVTDEQLIARYADDEEGGAGIYLAGVGVGEGYNDTLMDTVTDVGRGAYVFLDSEAEATHMLGDRFLQVVDVAARAVRLEMTLPWYLGVEKFYGEAISTNPNEVRPQHLAPNSAMLFFQILQACDASLLNGDDRIRLRATWVTPFSRESKQAVIDTTLNALAGDDRTLTKAAAIAGYAEALSRMGATTDRAERQSILESALSAVRNAEGSDTDPALIEIAALLEAYLPVAAL